MRYSRILKIVLFSHTQRLFSPCQLEMKKILWYALLLPLFLQQCNKETFKKSVKVAVGKPVEEIRNSFKVLPPKPIAKPAGVYAFNQYLLLLEQNVGINIVDNSAPENPVSISFIQLLSNTHVVVKNNVILADNGVDLISIDISDIEEPVITNRIENVFKDKWLEEGKTIFTGFETQKVSILKAATKDTIEPSNNSEARRASIAMGKGGSETKFAILDNYLYILKTASVLPVDISNPLLPQLKEEVGYRESGFETIFPYQKHLYIGGNQGILILDATLSPATPNFISYISRTIRGCDPVVVQDQFMFSTVRQGSACNPKGISTFRGYNISNKSAPYQIFSENLEEPFGLGIDGALIFLCQGKHGLDVYEWNAATQKATFKYRKTDLKAFDVICHNKLLVVAAEDGLYQYNYSNPNNIYKLTKLVNYDF